LYLLVCLPITVVIHLITNLWGVGMNVRVAIVAILRWRKSIPVCVRRGKFDFRDKGIFESTAALGRLIRVHGGKDERIRVTRHIHIVSGIESDAPALITAAPTKVRGIDESRASGVHLCYESVAATAAVRRLESIRCDMKVG
jgi:hypothetical protein